MSDTKRNGSPEFYNMLEEMANIHDKKSHDYASDKNPMGNYHFAGMVSALFAHSPQDAGFAGRIAEKLYRLSNLEASGKSPKNESIEDTERDIATITVLWMTDRRERRIREAQTGPNGLFKERRKDHFPDKHYDPNYASASGIPIPNAGADGIGPAISNERRTLYSGDEKNKR